VVLGSARARASRLCGTEAGVNYLLAGNAK